MNGSNGGRDLRTKVVASLARALEGQTPAALLAYSFDVDRPAKVLLLKAHFDRPPTATDIESIQVVDTEILADFLDDLDTETIYETVMPGCEPQALAGGIIYRRPIAAG